LSLTEERNKCTSKRKDPLTFEGYFVIVTVKDCMMTKLEIYVFFIHFVEDDINKFIGC
jgi:hypothetical protein